MASAPSADMQQRNPPSRILYVANAPRGCTSDDVLRALPAASAVVQVELLPHGTEALVEMESLGAAQGIIAFAQFSTVRVNGQPVRVAFSNKQFLEPRRPGVRAGGAPVGAPPPPHGHGQGAPAAPAHAPVAADYRAGPPPPQAHSHQQHYQAPAPQYGAPPPYYGSHSGAPAHSHSQPPQAGGQGASYGMTSHAGQQEGAQRTLMFTITAPYHPIDVNVIAAICKNYGSLQRVHIFEGKTDASRGQGPSVQALVELAKPAEAAAVKAALDGQQIYDGCCNLRIMYARHESITVKENSEVSRDFTNPHLPDRKGARAPGGPHYQTAALAAPAAVPHAQQSMGGMSHSLPPPAAAPSHSYNAPPPAAYGGAASAGGGLHPHQQHLQPAQPAYQGGGAYGAPPGYGQGPSAVSVGGSGYERDHRRDSLGGPGPGAGGYGTQQAGAQHYGQQGGAGAGYYGAERRGGDDYRRPAVVDHRAGPGGPSAYTPAGPAGGVYDHRSGGQAPGGGGMATPGGGYARGGVPLPPASVGGSSGGYSRDYRGGASTVGGGSVGHGTPASSSVAGRSMGGQQSQDYRAGPSAGSRGGYPVNGSSRPIVIDHRAGAGVGGGAGGAGNGPMGGPGCVLMVYNLPRAKVGAQQLFNAFCMFGNVVRVKLLSKPENSAMVQMENAGCAVHALEGLNRLPAFGVTISVTTSRQTEIAPLRPGPNGDTEGVIVVDYWGNKENRFRPGTGPQHQHMKANSILYFGNVPGDAPDAEAYVRSLLDKAGAPSPLKVTFLPPKEQGHGHKRGRPAQAAAAPAPAPAPSPAPEAPGTEGSAPAEAAPAPAPAPAPSGPAPRRSGFLEFSDVGVAIEALLLANNIPIEGNRFPFKLSFSGKTELKESGSANKTGSAASVSASAGTGTSAAAGEASAGGPHPPSVRSRSRSRERTDGAPTAPTAETDAVPEGVDDHSDTEEDHAAVDGSAPAPAAEEGAQLASASAAEAAADNQGQEATVAGTGNGQGLLPAPAAGQESSNGQAAMEAEDAATDQE